MYTNHIAIMNDIKAKGKAKVVIENITEFKQAFEIFNKCEIDYEETYKNIYRITLKSIL